MSTRTIGLSEELHRYVVEVGTREDDLLRRLRAETLSTVPDVAEMQISPEQGQFMTFLARAIGARRAIEVGTFTGYSSVCLARGLPADGKLVCIDSSDEWTKMARRYWSEAGLAERIDLRLGDGVDQLDRMIASGESGNYDLCFHDADKARSDAYVERFLRLLRPGGVFLVDNALRDGRVLDPQNASDRESTMAIVEMSRRLREDERIDWCLLPVGDGVAMGRKR
jgi:caffeoyl-CoA O-methyltransferase